MESVLPWALDRVRRRCKYETVYTYDELRNWLLAALPLGWRVAFPSMLGDNALSACWPEGDEREEVRDLLAQNGVADPEDFIDGACEPLALALTDRISVILESYLAGFVGDVATIPDDAHAAELTSLHKLGNCNAAMHVFGDFLSGANSTCTVWGGRSGHDGIHIPTASTAHIPSFLFGGSGVQQLIRDLAEALATTEPLEDGVASMPLYVLNYIWDLDELTQAELGGSAEETAQYSCHVVGLVMDASRRMVFVADPNGAPIPGGNLEFLAVPPRRREDGIETTKHSSFDQAEKKSRQSPPPPTPGEQLTICLLQELPLELALNCAVFVACPRARVDLCLALPPLGLAAIRDNRSEFDAYREFIFMVAMWLATNPGATIDHVLLRRYAADSRATREGAAELSRWDDSVGLRVSEGPFGCFIWSLRADGNEGAMVRRDHPEQHEIRVQHYEGEKGVERTVRVVCARLGVIHFEGEKGVERQVHKV